MSTRTQRRMHLASSAILWPRQPSKEFVVDHIARGETAESASQKLPSTAILSPQNSYVRFNRSIRSLPLEGMPAGLGHGQ